MVILVINAGSSSLKYQLLNADTEEVLAKGSVERIGLDDGIFSYKADTNKIKEDIGKVNHHEAVCYVLDALINKQYGVISKLEEIEAVGHRVVHGGEDFRESHLLDDRVMNVLKDNIDIAPLHNPANIVCIEACKNLLPNIPMVGVFDTAFHQTIPPKGYLYAIPMEAYKKHKIRRYGFHGISHNYVANRTAEILNKDIIKLRLITCHLGNGSSVTAIKYGEVIDTSMGFTPLEGLVMGTRCGDIDPTIIQYLINKTGMTLDEAITYLNKKSGVLGISGISSDFRDLDKAIENGDENAELAIDLFCYRVKKYIGAYVAAMGGVDAIIFTAGIGENSPEVREKIFNDMDFIHTYLHEKKNYSKDKEKIISDADSEVTVMVVPTNEELMIARETVLVCNKIRNQHRLESSNAI